MGGWGRWALVNPDGVAPSRMVGVSASVNLPLHHKVQKFSSGIGSPGWYKKKGRKTVVMVVVVMLSNFWLKFWGVQTAKTPFSYGPDYIQLYEKSSRS